mgnify:CR=1 FL=1|jgi:hypothetical protein
MTENHYWQNLALGAGTLLLGHLLNMAGVWWAALPVLILAGAYFTVALFQGLDILKGESDD